MTDLIICEKPNVSKKIADALGKPKKKSNDGVPYYEIERNGKKIIVASAVGHLYTLEEKKSDEKGKNKGRNSFGRYPIFDIRWVPASTIKGKEYVQKYINTLNKLSKKSNDYYIASDWDIEGELIGYHALRYCCNEDNAKRMRFSSLTKKDIIKAYEQPDNIDFGLVDAGDTRHRLDWYYGINMSVALMQCIRSVNRWHTMSTGRVQGPALSFLVDRELEIRKFVPVPYWVIDANLKDGLIAIHEKDKFWDEKEANTIYNKIKDEKEAIVANVKKTKKTIKPNPPFDLGALQREAHRIFKFSPKKTQEIAQKLYEKAICSYPRTSSQKLPKDDNYINDILNKVVNHNIYGKYAKSIIEEGRKPIEGKKDDPAHPAIHFVDTPKEELPPEEQKLYDLIVRRTLAVFWDNAEREYSNISLDIGGEIFKLSGSRTIKEGWHEIYYFTKFDETELPALRKNNKIVVEKINIEEKETKPPKRYTMSSIIKELENRELGTKSTRADIVEKLVKRGYLIEDNSLTVTDLGIGVIEVLKKYCPEIIDEQMTRELEKKLDRLQKRTIKKETVLKDAEKKLTAILNEVKKKEKEIGAELVEKVDATNKTLQTIGKCECGGDLGIIRIKNKRRFVGCSNYPECTIAYPLPAKGRIKIPNEVCEVCGKPMLLIDNQKLCVNTDCPSKISEEDKKELEKLEKSEKPCPKCDGTLTVKKGVYGVFLGCSNYPKCKYTEKLHSKKEDSEITVVGECPDCGGDLVIKKGRFGEFIACSNYPKCKHTEKIKKDGKSNAKATKTEKTETKTTKKKSTKGSTTKEKKKPDNSNEVGECPDCGGDLVIKKGRFGEFIACSNYPKCKHTEKIKKD
ncbi:DNA topoisomerase I [Methanococcus aeolicus Nankai-3]|uniref:DNA topoisomerase 1 n=1 Tax=Methanococcus aeolicus (strain ATCC BAA-1280 / DSM 17508 / OCM 812 / Nankai-3) TaxID=419665 RepID=A6USZ7_META3|nr:DNA topoisomerase I [Methanococcus aeolicus]ABR55619.1 DNA topoisomerase I [Methanococcus aeolicus Nankai-3]